MGRLDREMAPVIFYYITMFPKREEENEILFMKIPLLGKKRRAGRRIGTFGLLEGE